MRRQHGPIAAIITSPVYLVCSVGLVYLVHLVSFVRSNTRDRPNRPDRRDRPKGPNEQDRLADFFNILLIHQRQYKKEDPPCGYV